MTVDLTGPPTGSLPACTACGKALALRTPAQFICIGCNVRSKPTTADPNAVRPCPKCRSPLIIDGGESTAKPISVSQAPTLFADSRVTSPTMNKDIPGFADWSPNGPQLKADNSASSLTPGGQFGRYRIERELARGGMGIVFIVTDPQLKRRVALKVLIAGETASNEAVQRFVREARAAGQLRHPNIVAVHDAGEIDGRHFFTMDLIAGQELGKIVEAGGVARDTILEWIRTVSLALHHAHQHGIIHRDLKPQNIMIEGDKPILMDFGLAKEVDANSFRSLSGTVFGTPAYMSPEQAQGLTHAIDRRTDIYSLGVILYELICGQRPFGGDTLFDTISAVVNEEPRTPVSLRKDVAADLNTIILRCMEKDPVARYATAKDLADDLGRLLAGESINAKPIAAPLRLWRKLRKRPALLAGIGGGVIAAVLAITLFGGEALVARLQREVASGDPERQRAAAVLIAGELHDGRLSGAQRDQGLALLRQLAEGRGPAAVAAIAALVEANDSGIVPTLRRIAEDGKATVDERQAAAKALATVAAKTPEAKEIAEALITAAAAGNEAALAGALIPAAMTLDPEAAAQTLSGPIVDAKRPSPWRVEAVQSLSISRPSLHSTSMRLLLRLASDPDAAVGDAAARGLDLVRTRAEILPIYGLESRGVGAVAGLGKMAKAVADRDREFAQLAAEDEDGGRTPVAVIASKLSAGEAEVRLAAASDLGRLGDATALPHLYTALDDRDSGVRRAAGRSLAALAPSAPPDIAAISRRLEAMDSGVRGDAAWTLGLLEAREAVATLIGLAASATEVRERQSVITALGRIGDPAALPTFQSAWTAAQASGDEESALVIVTALGGHKALGGAAIDALIVALDHRSRGVRDAAGAALTTASGEKLGPDPARWKAWRQRAK